MGDLFTYNTPHRILSIRMDEDDRQLLHLEWSDGWCQDLHALWLREQCTCSQCRHPASLERILDQTSYSLDLVPTGLSMTGDGALLMRWPQNNGGDRGDSGHESCFEAPWLRHLGRPPVPLPPRRSWGSEMAAQLPRFDYSTLMAQDEALLDWLETLRRTGLTYVEDAPIFDGTVSGLARRIGTVRETNFGGIFEVVARQNSISNAYTSVELPLHVDLPAREYQPGLQFLHCLSNQATGGQSLYCDGLRIAETLRATDPHAFDLLTRVPILFRYHDGQCDYQMSAPLIGLSEQAEVREIRFNPAIMTTAACPQAQFREFQAAYRQFLVFSRDPALRLEIRMQAGQIAVFDNRRVLHGRRAFAADGGRHLQGAYVEWEDVDSRIRVLRRNMP
jgi:gamma-butyrobetaine dioxygenase